MASIIRTSPVMKFECSSMTHPAKFLDCCAKLECNSSRLAHAFSISSIFLPYRQKALTVTRINLKPAVVPVVTPTYNHVVLPRFPGIMDNYELGDWRSRTKVCLRMNDKRKLRQEQLMDKLYFYLRQIDSCDTKGSIKATALVNGKTVHNISIPQSLRLYYILNVIVQCPELIASNRDRYNTVYGWYTRMIALPPTCELKNIDATLYNNTIMRTNNYKNDLYQYLTLIKTRSDFIHKC
jgi:hypothetical protein